MKCFQFETEFRVSLRCWFAIWATQPVSAVRLRGLLWPSDSPMAQGYELGHFQFAGVVVCGAWQHGSFFVFLGRRAAACRSITPGPWAKQPLTMYSEPTLKTH